MSNSFGKNYGMNKKCISILTYLTAFILFLLKGFVDYVNIMNTNIIIKGPDTELCYFLYFFGIWMLITENPGINQMEYFSQPLCFFLVGAKFV